MSGEITIRPLTAEDLPRALEIERQSHSHPWTQRNFEDAFAAGYGAFGVWRDGELIAFAWVMRHLLDEAELLDIAVLPHARRAGVARALLIDIERSLRDTGCDRLHLEVRASNVGACALYAALGFDEVGVRVGYYPAVQTREDAILMRKELRRGNA
jgi:[ribosomal protein S18]-alanine N-acetyltransferase